MFKMRNKIMFGIGMVFIVLLLGIVSSTKILKEEVVVSEGIDKGKLVSSVNVVSSDERKIISEDFSVKNDFGGSKQIVVKRFLDSNEEIVSHNGRLKYMEMEHFSIPYIEYTASLGEGESKNFELKLRYKKLKYYQRIEPIRVFDAGTGELLVKTGLSGLYLKCKFDGFCNLEIGENHKNCPEDCGSGLEDVYCDRKKDGKCDPDCLTELDLDCGVGEGKSIAILSPPKEDPEEKQTSQTINSDTEKISSGSFIRIAGRVIQDFSEEAFLDRILVFLKRLLWRFHNPSSSINLFLSKG